MPPPSPPGSAPNQPIGLFGLPKSMLRAPMVDPKLTKSERETLKAVYRLTKGNDPAHTGDLADKLEVSPSTVTTTIKRLADRGLVEHVLYKGVVLTDPGRHEAISAIRRHRIVE